MAAGSFRSDRTAASAAGIEVLLYFSDFPTYQEQTRLTLKPLDVCSAFFLDSVRSPPMSSLFGTGVFASGTVFGLLGLVAISAYYAKAWATLRKPALLTTEFPETRKWPPAASKEMRFLQIGIGASVVVYVLVGAFESPSGTLMTLTGALLGLGGALAVAGVGAGFVALWHLWKELVLQLRQARIARLLLSLPLALVGLAAGLGAFVLLGWVTEKLPPVLKPLYPEVIWFFIAIVFYLLWKGRSHLALFIRLILLVLFTAVISASVALAMWWVCSQTTYYLMIISLSAIGAINTLFYAAFVRDSALADNLIDPSSPPPDNSFR
jgi:hypothetical protein